VTIHKTKKELIWTHRGKKTLRRWTVDRPNSGSSVMVGFDFKGIEDAD